MICPSVQITFANVPSVKAGHVANPRISVGGYHKGGETGRSSWGPISVIIYNSTEHIVSVLTNDDTIILILLMRKFKFRKIWNLTKAIKLVNVKAEAQN